MGDVVRGRRGGEAAGGGDEAGLRRVAVVAARLLRAVRSVRLLLLEWLLQAFVPGWLVLAILGGERRRGRERGGAAGEGGVRRVEPRRRGVLLLHLLLLMACKGSHMLLLMLLQLLLRARIMGTR